jgi:hypothetical protein
MSVRDPPKTHFLEGPTTTHEWDSRVEYTQVQENSKSSIPACQYKLPIPTCVCALTNTPTPTKQHRGLFGGLFGGLCLVLDHRRSPAAGSWLVRAVRGAWCCAV